MSQGDSQGLLSEEEIKDFLQKSFDLDLDRDALIKPTSNVVFDIYAKFLDEIYGFQWRNLKKISDDNQDSFIKPLMVGRINFTINRYDVNTTFQIKDLLKPTRKRTAYFLNVLIFVRAQFEDLDSQWQAWKAEWAENKAEHDRAHSQLRSLRILRDELAIKKSSAKSIDEIKKIRDEERVTFENSQRAAAELHEKAQALKSDNERRSKSLAEKQAIGNRLDEEFQQLEKKLDLLNENRKVRKNILDSTKSIQTQTSHVIETKESYSRTQKKIEVLQRLMSSCPSNIHNTAKKDDLTNKLIMRLEQVEKTREARYEKAIADQTRWANEEATKQYRLAQLEQDKKKKKVQLSYRYERALKDLNTKNAASRELAQPSLKSEEIRNVIEAIKKERAEIIKTEHSMMEECQAQAEKANRQLETLLKRYEESKKKCEPNLKAVEEFNSRIEAILGRPKEVELPGNRTYIKESGSN